VTIASPAVKALKNSLKMKKNIHFELQFRLDFIVSRHNMLKVHQQGLSVPGGIDVTYHVQY